MLGVDNFEAKKIGKLHSLQQLTTFADPRCSQLRYRGLILEIICKCTWLQIKQHTIYRYFSGPVLNNKLFFVNGKRLSIFREPDFSLVLW